MHVAVLKVVFVSDLSCKHSLSAATRTSAPKGQSKRPPASSSCRSTIPRQPAASSTSSHFIVHQNINYKRNSANIKKERAFGLTRVKYFNFRCFVRTFEVIFSLNRLQHFFCLVTDLLETWCFFSRRGWWCVRLFDVWFKMLVRARKNLSSC